MLNMMVSGPKKCRDPARGWKTLPVLPGHEILFGLAGQRNPEIESCKNLLPKINTQRKPH
jgi:hypothetical protein